MRISLGGVLLLLSAHTLSCEIIKLDVTNFEHDTQASTGATTGDWLVKFFSPKCGTCVEFAPIWEEVATELKEMQVQGMGVHINVAEVELTPGNKELFDRFKVEQLPEIVLFRKGKMYRKVMESPDGHGHDKDKDKVIAFATEGFSAVQAVDVPKEKGFVDKLVEKVLGLFGKGEL
ncbi:unnamed protein product [Prorocentrum cordatum]|uniref:Thioredoxin domain-containing protein n=1 Tax=Prorocentrum cordatum TaxID=2364126 RepID=A0ABN9VFY2_9DINO|nr:unnamed protein product [Polarella glacialis]